MEIKIGVRETAREISFETSAPAATIEAAVAAALDGSAKLLKLTDDKGRTFLVPTASLAYVEIGAEETRRVGFIA
ncbi:MAG: DUF3107 domain-containing protein [Micrococcales bacterium]